MAMTKKRLLLVAAVPLTIAVTLGVLAMLRPSPGVTKANFDRIEKGMTRAEVEQIFGRESIRWDGLAEKGEGFHWMARDGSSALVMFVDECVTEKQWSDSNETILDKLRRWLHLR